MRNLNKGHSMTCTFIKDGYEDFRCAMCYELFINKKISESVHRIVNKIILKNGWYVEQNVKSSNQVKYHFFYNDLQLCNLAHDENKKFNKIMDLTNEKRICKRCIHIKNTWTDLNNYVTFHN